MYTRSVIIHITINKSGNNQIIQHPMYKTAYRNLFKAKNFSKFTYKIHHYLRPKRLQLKNAQTEQEI